MNSLKIKAKVVENGLTTTQVAEMLGVNPSTLYAKLSGKTEFNRLELSKLKDVLHLTMDEFNDLFFS